MSPATPARLQIRLDDLSGAPVQALLAEHLRGMHALSPPESVHALDLSGLRQPEVSFWTAWEGDQLTGCGALKMLDPTHAEIKSMRTAAAHLRKGVARQLLQHIIDEATRRGCQRLSLETGPVPGFAAAQALYRRFGFDTCGPFGSYELSPFSVFMTRRL